MAKSDAMRRNAKASSNKNLNANKTTDRSSSVAERSNVGHSGVQAQGKRKSKQAEIQGIGLSVLTRSRSEPSKPTSKKGTTPEIRHAAVSAPSSPQQSTKQVPQPSHGVPVEPKLLKRFYEALVILSILGRNRGEATAEEELSHESDPSTLNARGLRRSFTRHLAYLCDYEKGGDRATAIALQQRPQGVTYRFASNKSPKGQDRAEAFLKRILHVLRRTGTENASATERTIFSESVAFSRPRIEGYSKILGAAVKYVLEHPDDAKIEKDITFVVWLQEIEDALDDAERLCQICHDVRASDGYRTLAIRAADGAICAERFETIRHNIGRLNHTMKAVQVLVETSLRLPRLLEDFKVARVNSSYKMPNPLQERHPSLKAIAGRMVGANQDVESLQAALTYLDITYDLSSELREQCASGTWQPRVHAELILLDLFWTKGLVFVDSDRYIGCSKPACYCCYHYIQAHRGGFVVPACSNNNWLNWRAPDILNRGDEKAIKNRENILNEMAKKIRGDAITQIMERRGPNRRRPDSNTEISSVRQRGPETLCSAEHSPEEGLDDPSDAESVCSSSGPSEYDARSDDESLSKHSRKNEREEDSERDDDDDDEEEGGVSLA